MEQRDELERLKALEDRIAKAKAAINPPRAKQDHHSMAQVGWRMVVELVSGLGIGAGIGYGLDVLLDTQPFLLVLFTLLGFAAGVKTMMRSARALQAQAENTGPYDTGAEKGDKTSGG
ncbi:AtpZ/AtpI family protein [Roseinatronobacter sp. NSM]|uniref:AtpZ/AtpI family protein n=1 Tax=Roseinatronobacter sp. NSM TaxID=3457785 RepID=UPI004035813F